MSKSLECGGHIRRNLLPLPSRTESPGRMSPASRQHDPWAIPARTNVGSTCRSGGNPGDFAPKLCIVYCVLCIVYWAQKTKLATKSSHACCHSSKEVCDTWPPLPFVSSTEDPRTDDRDHTVALMSGSIPSSSCGPEGTNRASDCKRAKSASDKHVQCAEHSTRRVRGWCRA